MVENVIIIGAGPAGMSASIYNARAGLNPLVIAGSFSGGQLTLTTEVENYPGFESIMGPDLVLKMRKHAEKFGVRFINENVTKVEFSNKSGIAHKVYTFDKIYESQVVIIATGAKALWLNLPSEQRFRGKGVSACATCDGFFFREKTVAVVGGGDTALEEALTLTKFAKKVYIIHRRPEFRASKIMQDRVFKNKKIEIIWNSQVKEVLGDVKVKGVRLETDNQSKIIELEGLFVAIGHKPDTEIFQDQVKIDEKGYIITSQRLAMEITRRKKQEAKEKEQWEKMVEEFDFNYQLMTSTRGVFAAGDCVDFQYRQAATAAGMGVEAALEVERYLIKNLK